MDLAVDQRGLGNRWSVAGGLASWGLAPVEHIARSRRVLAGRGSGRIVTERARFTSVFGRWWPYWGNWCEYLWDARFRGVRGDRCELYYHVPWSAPTFLTLAYVHSGRQTSLSTVYAATLVLDEIARLKQSQAIVCHVTNERISDRLLERWGWQPHCRDWPGRHFIKRFYGAYPEIPVGWRHRLTFDSLT